MAYDNSNSGVLWRNNKRGDNDRAPNLKGNARITIDGVEYELDLAAWTRQSEKAGKYLSLSIKLRGSASGSGRQHEPRPDEEPDLAW